MMKRSIAFALICSFTISLWAQTFKGRVVDLAGNPIPYAALYLKELKTASLPMITAVFRPRSRRDNIPVRFLL